MPPLLTTVLDDASGAQLPLPAALAETLGGELRLREEVVFSNFVSSIDGVVALGVPGVSSGGAISGRAEADRFLMGLLRAVADVVLVGAGTLRDDHGHLWTPGYIHPPSAPGFAELRQALGARPQPRLAVVTARGDVDATEPAFQDQPVFITTSLGADRLRSLAIPGADVLELGAEAAGARAAVDALRAFGLRRVLCEGGPSVIGWLLREHALDECFVTLSPVLAGRTAARAPERPGMVSGIELLPGDGRWARLASLRRGTADPHHLFARYELTGA